MPAAFVCKSVDLVFITDRYTREALSGAVWLLRQTLKFSGVSLMKKRSIT